MSSLTLLSRIFGFIRDLLVARLFGATAIADCFFVAFKIPNLLRSFVAEGALTSAFVPVFTSELQHGKEAAQRTISSVLTFVLIVTSVISLLGIYFSAEIVSYIAPGFSRDPYIQNLCIFLTRIMFPYTLFISLVAMLNAALNSVKIFGIAALSQVLMNITLIAGALLAAYYKAETAVIILSISVIVGGLIQVIVQFPALKRAGFVMRPSSRLFTPQIAQLLALMLPAILGATVYQLSQFINTVFASLLITGTVSWLFYADRLTQLPIGIFSIALGSVLLPNLANARAAKDDETFNKNLVDSLRYTSFFIIPIATLIFYFSTPIIALMFERGAFDRNSTIQTSYCVKAFALGLWTVSCHSLVSRSFIARKDTVTPTIIGLLTLVVNVCLSLLLMGGLDDSNTSTLAQSVKDAQGILSAFLPTWQLGHIGLALSATISSSFAFFVLLLLSKVRLKKLDLSAFVISTAKVTFSCLLATLVVYQTDTHLTDSVVNSLVLMIMWGLVFTLASRLVKTKELNESWSLCRRKVRGE